MKKTGKLQKIVIVEIVIFILVIIFFWAEEIFDLPHLLLNSEPTPVNYQESLIETLLFTLLFGFLVYYTTKISLQMRKLESYIRICAVCHKIYIAGRWLPLDEYFNKYADKKTSHGLCDDCIKMYRKDM